MILPAVRKLLLALCLVTASTSAQADGPVTVFAAASLKTALDDLAARFAAKEAVIKALGEYLTDRPPYSSIEILADDNGRPGLSLPEALRDKIGGARCHISISHEEHYAVAVAVFEE